MATAGDVIKGALGRILVQGAEAPLEANDYSEGITYLNEYVDSLRADNIELGYTTVTNIADEVTIPSSLISPLKANLALFLAPQYSAPISPALAQEARDGIRRMRQVGGMKVASVYPSTLPTGSGRSGGTVYQAPFYAGQAKCVLTLNNNTRASAIASANVPVKVDGFWNVQTSRALRGDISGRITNLDSKQTLSAKATLSATGSGSYTFHIYQNELSKGSTAATLSATSTDVTVSVALTLQPGDEVTVWVESTGTNDPTVHNARFELG